MMMVKGSIFLKCLSAAAETFDMGDSYLHDIVGDAVKLHCTSYIAISVR